MFGRFVWVRWLLLFLFVLTFAVREGAKVGRTQVSTPRPPAIDLSGNWDFDGTKIVIDHLQTSGLVVASFNPATPCHGQSRPKLFEGRVKVTPVSGGEPQITLNISKFYACTRDKKLIDSCSGVTAVWSPQTRDVTVSSDGNTITGERFHEWYAYDPEENGRYPNCRRDSSGDSWSTFTLTRACEPDKGKKCASIERALKAIEKVIPPAVGMMPQVSFDPVKWRETLTNHRSGVQDALDEVKKLFCDDAGVQGQIDMMKAKLDVPQPGNAQTATAVRAEMLLFASVDLDLRNLSTANCAVSGPPPSQPSGVCPGGAPPKQPGDNEAIDQARKQIDDAIKEALKMLQDYEREAQGGASTTAGQYADYYRTRLAQLRKLKGYWDMIRSASCIPPELMNLIKAMMGGRTDMCVDLCYETAKWIETWYPGPNGDIQKKMFLELCGFNCP